LVGWWFRQKLIGRTLRGRFGGKTEVGPILSWFYGLFGATILAVLLSHFVAYALNRREGLPYTSIYGVTGKYEYHGKSSCNGLILTREHDPFDQFKVCVSPSQQDSTAIGDKMLINGLRSHYVNQMLGFEKIPDRDKADPANSGRSTLAVRQRDTDH
jgi:hypothetical protein